MKIKAVVWDIGGVIARTVDQKPRNELASELGITREYLENLVFSGPEAIMAQRGEISANQLWENIRICLDLKPGEISNLRTRFFGGDIVDYQMVDHIREIKKTRKTCVLSNAWSDLRDVINKEWKIADAFDFLVISGEEGVMKPNQKVFEICVERLGLNPDQVVFIDDFVDNIFAASSMGLLTIHFTSPQDSLLELQKILNLDNLVL